MSSSISMLLLGLQAAGSAIDFFGSNTNRDLTRAGERVNQAQISLNIESARTSAAEDSLAEMLALQSNLSSQFASQVARGTNPGAGSAMFIAQKSERVASDDERARQLNLGSKVVELQAQSFLSEMHQASSEARESNALTNRIFKSLPTQAGFESFKRSDLGKRVGFGFDKAEV